LKIRRISYITSFFIALLLRTFSSAQEDSRFGIECGFLLCHTMIDVPDIYKNAGVRAIGGNNFDIGAAGFYYAENHFRIGLGAHYWCVPFNPSAYGSFTVNNQSIIYGKLEESGNLNLLAIALDALFELRYAFCGLGLDFSFANWYKSTIRCFNSSNVYIGEIQNSKKSILTDKLNNQADFILKAGFKIPISNVYIRPMISFALPLLPLFDPPTTYKPYIETPSIVPNNSENFAAFILKYGICLSYGL
jgi:hypothetical protein